MPLKNIKRRKRWITNKKNYLIFFFIPKYFFYECRKTIILLSKSKSSPFWSKNNFFTTKINFTFLFLQNLNQRSDNWICALTPRSPWQTATSCLSQQPWVSGLLAPYVELLRSIASHKLCAASGLWHIQHAEDEKRCLYKKTFQTTAKKSTWSGKK